MTRPQLEALAELVAGYPMPVAHARGTAHGFVGARAARSLVDLGYASESGGGFRATTAGRRAYYAAVDR